MQLLQVVILAGALFAQGVPAVVDGPPLTNPVATQPSPGGPNGGPSGGSEQTHTTVVQNTTVVMPDPNHDLLDQTAEDSTPFAMRGGFKAADQDLGPKVSSFIDFGGAMSDFRNNVIFQPRVIELNQRCQQIAGGLLAASLAAIAVWGMLGQAFGSDAREAFEAMGQAPLWFLLAYTSVNWFRLMLNAFGEISRTLASTGHSAFGDLLTQKYWGDPALGLFGLFIGLVCLLWLMCTWLDVWVNTCFLAFCLATAPLFVMLGATPWTKRWAVNWFHMAPAAALDIMATSAMVGLAGPTLALLTGHEGWESPLLTLGLLLGKGRVQQLCRVESHSSARSIVRTLVISRVIHGIGRSGAAGIPRLPSPSTNGPSPTSRPTRAPRAPHVYAVSGQNSGTGGAHAATRKTQGRP